MGRLVRALLLLFARLTPRALVDFFRRLDIRQADLVSQFLRVSLVCGLALWNDGPDPLGFDKVTERFSRDLFNIAAAPLHPPADNTVVVLITEKTLQSINSLWPLSPNRLATLVDAILAREPRALMMDMLFLDQRGPDSDYTYLRNTLFHDYRLPIFLAAAPVKADELRIMPLLDPGRNGADHVHLVSVGVSDDDKAHYRIDFSDAPQRAAGEGSPLPASLAVYHGLCASGGWERCKDRADLARYSRPMDVFWGSRPPDYAALPGVEAGDPWLGRCNPAVTQNLALRLWKLLRNRTDELRDNCSTIPVIYAEDLLADAERIDALIKGRAVFLGASVQGVPDRINPPVTQPLAGVFLHAMAFENLMSMGPDYLGEKSPLWGLSADAVQKAAIVGVYLLLYVFLVLMAGAARRRRDHPLAGRLRNLATWLWGKVPTPRRDAHGLVARLHRPLFKVTAKLPGAVEELAVQMRPLLFGIGFSLASGLLLILAVVLEVVWLRLSPTNWLGILSLLSVASSLLAPGEDAPGRNKERETQTQPAR